MSEAEVDPMAEFFPAPIGVEGVPEPAVKPDSVTVFIDDREQYAAEMLDRLADIGVRGVIMRLENSDYIIRDIHITRKRWPDLLGSLESGHMHDELIRLTLSEHRVHLLIEGDANEPLSGETMARLAVAADRLNESVPVTIISTGMAGTAAWLKRMRDRVASGHYATLRRRPVIYGQATPLQTTLSTCKLGAGTAAAVEDKFHTLAAFVLAVNDTATYDKARWKTRKAWREARWDADIKGIGEETAERVAGYVLDGAA
jgi:ERCC4-type nuclease